MHPRRTRNDAGEQGPADPLWKQLPAPAWGRRATPRPRRRRRGPPDPGAGVHRGFGAYLERALDWLTGPGLWVLWWFVSPRLFWWLWHRRDRGPSAVDRLLETVDAEDDPLPERR